MSFYRNRRVFVTGATGLLGAHLVEELLKQGSHVVCLVRDWVPESRLFSEHMTGSVTVVRGDLEDYLLLLRALNEHEIDTVFHLGAQTIVSTASRSPLSTFETNIRGTYMLLEACAQNAKLIDRVVVASSDKAYGVHDKLPYGEDAPLVGRYPYDVSKSCADLISFSYYHTYGVPLAVTRCGNLFGGGDLNFNRLIPGTIRSVLDGEAPVIRSDGKFIRDYFYVKDAVEAYLVLGEAIGREGVTGQAFNFGMDSPLSVVEVVDQVLEVMGRKDLVPKILNEARHEIPEQYLDCARARTRLNWSPRRSFAEGLAEAVEWYTAFHGSSK